MKRNTSLAILVGMFVVILAACTSEPEPTATAQLTAVPESATTSAIAIATRRAPATDLPVVPDGAEIDRKTAMLLGIDLHRQLWATRPSSNYKFGFQWTTADFAYQRANVEVRVLKSEISDVRWADNAVKTDGTEPAGFVVPERPIQSDYYTIDGLFEVIEEAMDNDPANVTLGFDSVFGFPTTVDINFLPGSEFKDVSFFAAEVVPIPGPPE